MSCVSNSQVGLDGHVAHPSPAQHGSPVRFDLAKPGGPSGATMSQPISCTLGYLWKRSICIAHIWTATLSGDHRSYVVVMDFVTTEAILQQKENHSNPES